MANSLSQSQRRTLFATIRAAAREQGEQPEAYRKRVMAEELGVEHLSQVTATTGYDTLMARICRRFAEGGRPYSAEQLRSETGIPIRIVIDLLYKLIEARLLIEISSDEKGETSRFMPAESLDNLNVGTMVDRLEAQGTWKLDIPVSGLFSGEWAKAMEHRGAYLKSLRDINLQNLSI